MSCCEHSNKHKTCKRITDGKIFDLPRKFTKKECTSEKIKGFTMRSSCAPYKGCKTGGRKYQPNSSAVAILGENTNGISGKVLFTQSSKKGVKIEYEIHGLTDGKHGFHIHEYGDLSDGCKSACSHFNPFGKDHGNHAGDLGNISSSNGIAKGRIDSKILSLDFMNITCIIGRMIIVHKDEDDLGLGGNEESLITGNAGERVACGVIGLTHLKI